MKILRWIMPLLILFASIGIYAYMQNNAPEPRVRPKGKPSATIVDVIKIQNDSFTPTLTANGQVFARQQTKLTSEISSRITSVSADFVDGMLVKKGDLLIQLDVRRITSQIAAAKAEVTRARATLAEEKARGELALANWKRSGKTGEPSALTLRKPQLQSARANLAIAQSKLGSANLDLRATKIVAPYDSVVLNAGANLGEYVSPGIELGSLMSTDLVEVHLPLDSAALSSLGEFPIDVQVTTSNNRAESYNGILVRYKANIDEQTRLLDVIVEVARPFDYKKPLLPGMFVEASIPAEQLKNVAAIPLSAIDTNNNVSIAEKGLLIRKKVELVHIDKNTAYISGLPDGESLITSQAFSLPARSRIRVEGEETNIEKARPTKNNKGRTE